jgi:FK506-binding protein 4/5
MKKGEVAKFVLKPGFNLPVEDPDFANRLNVPPEATVVFEVELIGWTVRDDLTEDGGVVKSLQAKGIGSKCPKIGDELLICVKASRMDGSIVEDRGQVEYIVGSNSLGPISSAVDKALLSMKKLEHVTLFCTREYSYGDDTHDGVTVDLLLVEFVESVDILIGLSHACKKKRIKEGDGNVAPSEESKVKLQVESATDGSSALPGFSGPKLLEFNVCQGEVCDALEFTVLQMRKGERAILSCTEPALFTGSELGLTEISTDKVVVTVELVDIENGDDPWHMSDGDKYSYCTRCKEIGSDLFKKGRHAVALQRYKRVTELLVYVDSFDDETKKKAQELKTLCELNKAACMLKLGDNPGVKIACNVVLEDDKDNVKAIFRRATASFNMSELDDAMHDVKHILEVDSGNADAKRLMQQIQRAQREADKSAKSMYASMCKGLGKLNTPEPTVNPEDDIQRRAMMSSKDAFKDLLYQSSEERLAHSTA